MHAEECGTNFTGLCAKMKPINGEKLLTYLRHVNFTGKHEYASLNNNYIQLQFRILISKTNKSY